MGILPRSAVPPRWELAAEAIAVKIRWFGLLFGYLLVNLGTRSGDGSLILNAILALGAVYTLLDTWYSLRGRVFLGRYPLSIGLMEALFIGLLCYYHDGLESPFRFYYLLSLICCAVRYSSRVTYATCALHSASYLLLYVVLPADQRRPLTLVLTLVMLGWVTWASNAMGLLLKRVGEHLGTLNDALRKNQAQLEEGIRERTRELQETQAQLHHQEKMAAFGLLAAGIAHEVGNPLTSISSLVQMLERRDCDDYTREKLGLVSGQLQRIRKTLRELVTFSRPASTQRAHVALIDILNDALSILKYYKGARDRRLEVEVPAELPPLLGVRDQLVQVFLNLLLNAIDATGKGGRIEVRASRREDRLEVTVRDDGPGIASAHAERLFQPYFTTKKHGIGLGLFVTRKLVAEHGGTVDFSSGPAEGTTFVVTLPAAPVDGIRQKAKCKMQNAK